MTSLSLALDSVSLKSSAKECPDQGRRPPRASRVAGGSPRLVRVLEVRDDAQSPVGTHRHHQSRQRRDPTGVSHEPFGLLLVVLVGP